MSISHEELKRLLHYDPETGVWTWRVKIHPMQTPVGQPIRAVHRLGYVHFSIGGRKYLGHRLAWFYMTGKWPVAQIDHKDLNPSNNKWTNIRESTQTQNMGNLGLSPKNKIGLKGVHWAKKQKKFNAQIRSKGRNTHLGYFSCPAAAHFAYIIAADIAHGEFARAR
jgi:hypothetical protein